MRVKYAKKKIDVSQIPLGQEVRYSVFSNITFEGLDEQGQVILKDKYNNIKKVYRSLFEENVKIVKR